MRIGIGGGGFLRGGLSVGRGGPRIYGGVGPVHASVGGRGRRSAGDSDIGGMLAVQLGILLLIAAAVTVIVFVSAAVFPRILIPLMSLILAVMITGCVGWLVDRHIFRRVRSFANALFLFGSLFLLFKFFAWLSSNAAENALDASSGTNSSENSDWILSRVAWDGVSDGSEFALWVVGVFSLLMAIVWGAYLIRGNRVGEWFDSLADRIENG